MYSFPGASDRWVSWKPTPVPMGNPHLWLQVRVFPGTGAGCPKKPKGCPSYSLSIVTTISILFSAYLYITIATETSHWVTKSHLLVMVCHSHVIGPILNELYLTNGDNIASRALRVRYVLLLSLYILNWHLFVNRLCVRPSPLPPVSTTTIRPWWRSPPSILCLVMCRLGLKALRSPSRA